MPSRSMYRGAATHLLALVAGWAAVQAFHPGQQQAIPTAVPSGRPGAGRPAKGTSGRGLLDAYRNAQTGYEMLVRRNQQSAPVVELPVGTPEERAAAATDIAGDLNQELAKVKAHQIYDYPWVNALVARWLKEDPASCSAWIGSIDSRVGWGAVFQAFVGSLSPQRALDLMENGWTGTNRMMALSAIAAVVNNGAASELPGVISRLPQEERERFMRTALAGAKSSDATVWLQIAGSDDGLLNRLADKWFIPSAAAGNISPRPRYSPQDGDLALAAAQGTPAAVLFQQRHDAAELSSEIDATLARIPAEPAAAAAALEAIYRNQGLGPDEAQAQVAETLSQRYQHGLDTWNRAEWQNSLQQAVMGTLPMRDAVEGRLSAIDTELPGLFQDSSRTATLRDAMAIEPATVLELALDRGLQQDGVKAASEIAESHEVPLSVRAELFLALAGHDLWTSDTGRLNGQRFAAEYFEYDPEAAQNWRRSLPPGLATLLEEVMR